MILYSNGCSYTANNVLAEEKRYPQILAKRLGWDIMPLSIPGSSNRRIIRCTIRDCIKLLHQNKKIFAMIQLSHLTRYEFAGKTDTQHPWKYAEGDLFESFNGPDASGISHAAHEFNKYHFLLHDSHAELTRLMADIIGLTAFFKQHDIDYIIFTGPKIHVPIEKVESDLFYQYCKNDHNILDLLEFNMLDLTGKQTHPDEQGMQLIADYFFNLLCEPV
jgi:hypothetical protein